VPVFGGAGELLGRSLATLVTIAQGAIAFLLPPLYTAGLITQEKRDRTLGLLILADLSGRDVYLAKFLRAFVQVELLILSLLPFAAFAAMFGGVSVPELALHCALFSAWAAALCALGLLYSTVAERPGTALFLTAGSLFAWAYLSEQIEHGLIPYAAPGLGPVPIGISHVFAPEWPTAWIPLTVAGVVFVVASLVASYLLPRQIHRVERAARRRRNGRSLSRELFPPSAAERLLSAGGIGFIGRLRSTILRMLVFVALAAFTAFPYGTPYVVVMLLCYDIIAALQAARTNGALDDLLVTPLSSPVLGRALYRVALRQASFYGAAMVAGRLFFGAWMLLHSGLMPWFPYMPVDTFAPRGLEAAAGIWVFGAEAVAVLVRVCALAAGAAFIGLHRGAVVFQVLTALALALVIDVSIFVPSLLVRTAGLAIVEFLLDQPWATPLLLVLCAPVPGGLVWHCPVLLPFAAD
jgi:hypothetical protein